MPIGGKCDHNRCDGLPCKKLTPEELEPLAPDLAFAQRLIDDEWLSVSSKHRRVARLTEKWPRADSLIQPTAAGTEHGQELAKLWHYHSLHIMKQFASGKPSEYVEAQVLTIKQFRAFKRLGGGIG